MAGALVLVALFLTLLLPIYLLLTKETRGKLPPGSMGFPVIGQSLALLRAMRANTAEEWFTNRIKKYGPVSKLSLFGKRTIFVTGVAANKFIYENKAFTSVQPQSMSRLFGRRSILGLSGADHRRVRGAIVQFLKPDVLKKFVPKLDQVVRDHIEMNWVGRQHVTVSPLIKRLTFDVISSLMFGLEQGPLRVELLNNFMALIDGAWAVPMNLPFTRFNNSLRASKKARKVLTRMTREKQLALNLGSSSPCDDLITYMLSLEGEDTAGSITEEEIVDTSMAVMAAGYDTSSVLIIFLIRQLVIDRLTYQRVIQEQEDIAKSKAQGEALTWEDLSKMKYTWQVALETLRSFSPALGLFKKATKDIEYQGYLIPKGWTVFMATSVTHMDAAIFNDPSKFDPSHFNNQSVIPPYSFLPFSAGARMCPGNELVRLETLVAVHYLVTRFKLKLCGKDIGFCRDPVPTPAGGLPVEVEYKSSL